MNTPGATGHVDMDTSSYIPLVYAKALLVWFYTCTVFAAIANTEYEGEIKSHGSEVVIKTLPNIVTRKYKKGQDLEVQKDLDSTPISLKIDQAEYYNIPINSVDVKQADTPFVNEWAKHASEVMKQAIDMNVLHTIPANAASYNMGDAAGKESGDFNFGKVTAPLQVTAANVIKLIVDAGTCLDEANVPESDRWMVLPAWMIGLIKQSDIKDASLTGDSITPLRNGQIGKIDRFTIYSSNQILKGVDGSDKVWSPIFGQKSALTFASQMVESDEIDNQKDFGKLMRGLQVYGFKVVKEAAMGAFYVKK